MLTYTCKNTPRSLLYSKITESPKPFVKKTSIIVLTVFYLSVDRSIVHKFDVGKATALRSVDRVVRSLYLYRNFFIQLPSDNEIQAIAARVQHVSGFPGVFAAIDGFHVKILRPSEDPEAYINRKRYPSVQTQVSQN